MGAQRADREPFIDATRGVAMLSVLVAHFSWIYFGRNPGTPFDSLFTLLYFASPTFMLTSGIVVGYVYDRRPARFDAFRVKLADRGLFLLVVGHIVISLAYVRYAGGVEGAFRFAQILDPIAVAIIVAPALLPRTSIAQRLLLAGVLYALSWTFILGWSPAPGWPSFAKATLFGGGDWWAYNFPIVPWVALYLVGTGLGQTLQGKLRKGDSRGVSLLLLGVAMGAVVAGASIALAGRALGTAGIGNPAVTAALREMSSPFLKLPPSPAYFLFWGGVGLLLILSVFLVTEKGWLPRATRLAEVVGQNSLFIFLLQEHLYVLVLWTWNPPYGSYWPLLLLGTIAFAVTVTYVWHLLGWSRHLTVGYGRWWGPRLAEVREPRKA